MKMKKLAPVFAMLLGLSSLAACTQTNEKVAFGEYWRSASLDTAAFSETLVYSVEEKEPLSIMYNYGLAYEKGTYTTNLIFDEKTNVYTYTTELTIDAVYTLGDQTSVPLHDRITTKVQFHSADNALLPIASEKRVISHSPVNTNAVELSDCYATYNYEIKTFYTANAETVSSTVTYFEVNEENSNEGITDIPNSEPSQTGEITIDHSKYNYLDNEQLPLALRAIPTNENSAKIQAFNPFVKRTQNVALSFASDASAEFKFKQKGEDVTKTLTYRPVTMVLDERNPGGTQTAWIAKASNQQANEYHNVMLRLETPISYGLGTLVYTLVSTSW